MSIDNVKKLENAINKLCHWDERMSDEDNQKIVNDGGDSLSEIAATKDINVLERMFDYLIEEKSNVALYNGVCETLESEIFENYTMEQVIEALYKKFPELVVNNEMRAEGFAVACLNTGNFDKFRDIFNKTKISESKKFLNGLNDWIGEDYPEEISILRKDMEAWPKK